MAEREKQKLQLWSRIMPCRQSFAWPIFPLFESHNVAAAAGSVSPSIPLTPNVSGPTPLDTFAEHVSKITLDGKQIQYSSGRSVIMEISNLNKVKESYTEDLLLDPKRKVHKPVKGVLKLEVEKLHTSLIDVDNISDGGSIIIDSTDAGDPFTETSFGTHHSNGPDILRSGSLTFISINRKDICRTVSIPAGEDHPEFGDDVCSI
ncbi:guanine nucleotide exchange factor SPIKE 1-like [Curcuma longa]|uniref:guanine nucleotide exchange factor SPIKE 1-like n=1 Tax=Curcuma longa TaxID=136217 RepID=UPI003D9EA45D